MGNTVQRVDAVEDGTSMMRVFNICKTLHDGGITPTRELIAEKTGYRLTTVDEALKQLRKLGWISREPACYRPLTQFPEPRAISGSPLDDGAFKLEIGDTVLTLTPEEARQTGLLLQGHALECVALLSARIAQDRIERLEQDNRRMLALALKQSCKETQQMALELDDSR